MSVQWGLKEDEETARLFGGDGVTAERVCFMCAERLEYPYQLWSGPGGKEYLFLHPQCAIRLAEKLLVDAQRAMAGLKAWREERRRTAWRVRAWALYREAEKRRVVAGFCGINEPFTPAQIIRFLAETDPDGAREPVSHDEDAVRLMLFQWRRQGVITGNSDDGYRFTEKAHSERAVLREEHLTV